MLTLLLASRPALAGLGAALLLAVGSTTDHTDVTSSLPTATVTVDTATSAPTHLQLGSGIAWTSGEDTADPHTGAPRPAMVKAVAGLGLRALRFPSGLYSNCYDWRLAVGPLSRRKSNWNNYSATGPVGCYNKDQGDGFGTDEFMSLVARISKLQGQPVEPIITVNICGMSWHAACGSGFPPICPHPNNPDVATGCPGALIAAHWVEYLNGAASTPFGAARAGWGHPAPYGVHWFEIGNETQISETPTAPRYSDVLRTYARAMRAADPSIGIIAQGTCICSRVPDGPLREATLMSTVGSEIDAVAPHIYERAGDSDGLVSRFLSQVQDAIVSNGGAGRVRIMPTEWAAMDTGAGLVDNVQRWGDMRAAVNDATDWVAFLRHGVSLAPFFTVHGPPFSLLHCAVDNPLDTGDRCAAPEVPPYQSLPARVLGLLASNTGPQTLLTHVSGPVKAATTGDGHTVHVDLVNIATTPLRVTVAVAGATGLGTATLVGLHGGSTVEDLARSRDAYPAAAAAVLRQTLATLAGASQLTVTLPATSVSVLTVPVGPAGSGAASLGGAAPGLAPVAGALVTDPTPQRPTIDWWHGWWRIRLS
jgi:alpha-L-arabinofuranosidase